MVDAAQIDEAAAPIVSGNGAAKKTKRGRAPNKAAKKSKSVAKANKSDKGRKKRQPRPYPVVAFNQATTIGDAILKFAGIKVRRMTLLEKLNLSPTSSTTQMMITNSSKYKITKGSFVAEWLELTPEGKNACDPEAAPRARLENRFALGITGVVPFKVLYDECQGKKLVAREVMHDILKDHKITLDDYGECIDIFVTNLKDLGLLRTIAGSENLIPIAQALDELGAAPPHLATDPNAKKGSQALAATQWDKICFYVSPIGDEGSDKRKHSDLFMSALIEPAMAELGLTVVRADQVDTPGMITKSIIEHLKLSRLVIADLSTLNPMFY